MRVKGEWEKNGETEGKKVKKGNRGPSKDDPS